MRIRPALMVDAPLRRALKASERAGAIATFRLLRAELGTLRGISLLSKVALEQARGEPWRKLGAPKDERDTLSRTQIGGAVLLHRALRSRMPVERATRIVSAIANEGGMVFLGDLLGFVNFVEAYHHDALEGEIERVAARFFNAEGEVEFVQETGVVHFDVERCRFVELLDAVGERALAPIFCEVDHAYFNSGLTPLKLKREETIAGGDERCAFRFTMDAIQEDLEEREHEA